jgi:hypothetical protein
MDGSGRRSSEEEILLDAQKWLNAIVSSAGPDIGLIVVGTHADAFQLSDAATDHLEGLLKTLKEMVADVEYDYVLRNIKTAVVDNKNDFGISELETNLYKTAKGLLSDILVPLSWLRLLEKVREELPLKDNEICASLDKIQNLAKTIGIMEKDRLCRERTNRIFKDTGLYTIVTPSTSPHPTPLEHRYKGYLNYPGSMFCSNITLAVAKYASRCALVQVKICSSGLACKIALSESLT